MCTLNDKAGKLRPSIVIKPIVSETGFMNGVVKQIFLLMKFYFMWDCSQFLIFLIKLD